MTDNEIIKALEEIVGMRTLANKSPKIETRLLIAILDLINRQKAEIEGLQKRIVFWREDMDYRPAEIRAEAIKEFAERLKENVDMGIGENFTDIKCYGLTMQAIDNLVKEMTEGKENA